MEVSRRKKDVERGEETETETKKKTFPTRRNAGQAQDKRIGWRRG